MNGSSAILFRDSPALASELEHFRGDNTDKRFTIDGSPALERHLAETCRRVLSGVEELIPARKLEAVILGGGYGRGQGGVLQADGADAPYNDMEFYVFLTGSRLWNERRYGKALEQLGEELSPEAGLHIEFKIDSFARFQRAPVTMFSFDLLAGHRVLFAPGGVFPGCHHHFFSYRIPLHEATRLLMNRCTGLLLAKERLNQRQKFTADDSDFVARNLAKLKLALGDVVLTMFERYDWDCRERQKRLLELAGPEMPHAGELITAHQEGVAFKLHPRRLEIPAATFESDVRSVSALAQYVWLWLENRRLGTRFASTREYALSAHPKCTEVSSVRAGFVNARLFGIRGLMGRRALHYPRERLLNSLPLLLWDEVSNDDLARRHLQNQLRSPGSDWQSFVAAYKRIWPSLS